MAFVDYPTELVNWQNAMSALTSGAVAEYRVGSRMLKKIDLKEIREHIKWLHTMVNGETNGDVEFRLTQIDRPGSGL